MIRIVFFLLIAIFVNTGLTAQQVKAEKKEPADGTASKTGFKKQSPPPGNKSTLKNPVSAPIESSKTQTGQSGKTSSTVAAKNSTKVLEMVSVDYKNMPATVQSRINSNKSQGKYLLDGIDKVFLVEIKSCLTDADRKKTLAFLKNNKGYINSQLVSAGLVKIIVLPEFDSSDLKDAMSAQGIHFNFLNRSYLLKN